MARLVNQFSWILVGRVLAAGIQAGTLILLARSLPLSDFGLLNGALGVVIVLQAVADLGISKLLIRERAKDPSSGMISDGLLLNSRLSFLLFIIISAGFIMAGLVLDSRFLMMIPLAVSAAGEKNADTWLGIAVADGDVWLNSTNLVVRRLLALIVFIACLQVEFEPILAYTIGVAVGAVVSVLFSRKVISERVPKSGKVTRAVIIASMPFWVNSLVSQLRNFDSAIVGLLAGTVTAGYYSAAAKLTSPMRMLPDSLAQVLLPYATRSRNKSVLSLFKIVMIFSIVMTPIYLLLTFCAPWIVPILLGGEYIPAISAIQIVFIGLVFSSLNSLLRSIMQGRGMQNHVATVAVVVTITMLLLILILTPNYGANGAAFALSSGFLIELILSLIILFVIENGRNSAKNIE